MDSAEQANVTKLVIAKEIRVPMSLIDGRPWVPTAAESDASVDLGSRDLSLPDPRFPGLTWTRLINAVDRWLG